VFDHSGSVMNFKEGRRSFGLEIRALLEAASESLTDQMDRERRSRTKREDQAMDDADAERMPADAERGNGAND
jgi:hypothetical protein